MKILAVNKFFYPKGGSEIYLKGLSDYQRQIGHELGFFSMKHPDNWPTEYEEFFIENQQLDNFNQSLAKKIKLSSSFFYSREAAEKIRRVIDDFNPDIAHLHNIYHQLSPSVLAVLKDKGIPSVLTLHDYKLVCPNNILFANGQICDECKGKYFYKAVRKRCVKGSALASAICALESTYHRVTRKYIDFVDVFVSPSEWLKNKFIEFGFPEKKIKVVNNYFIPSKASPEKNEQPYILFAGRISDEKGIATLVKSMQANPGVNLKIAGEGPALKKMIELKERLVLKNVEFLGHQPKDVLNDLMSNCRFFVIPSQWFENAPLVILEAFSFGKPVVGSNLGGIAELITDKQNGRLFSPGDYSDLSNVISELWHNQTIVEELGKNAYQASNKYTIADHSNKIMAIYEQTIEEKLGSKRFLISTPANSMLINK